MWCLKIDSLDRYRLELIPLSNRNKRKSLYHKSAILTVWTAPAKKAREKSYQVFPFTQCILNPDDSSRREDIIPP